MNNAFLGGRSPTCMDAADANDDGRADIGDPIFTLGSIFLGPAPPPAPGARECGPDLTADAFTECAAPACQ